MTLPKIAPEALLSQWHHLQFALERVSKASAQNISQRIQTVECEREVFDELLRRFCMESLGEFPTK